MESINTQPGFFARLKQHHIYRVAVGYGTTIAVLIQVVARAFPYFGWAAVVPVVIIIMIAGFPVAVVLAWLLEKPAGPLQQTDRQKRHWKLRAVVITVVIAAVVVSGIYAFRFSEQYEARIVAEQIAAQAKAAVPAVTSAPPAVNAIPAKSIAVLPFENLSSNKDNAYFADGMQDLILTKLADIGDLVVVSRTSTLGYGSHPENVKTIGQQLGVATLLEGSVQKAGNQVLINVQLIDAHNDHHIWAQSYQRSLVNVFGVEGEVAEQIATALNAKLSPAETQRLATALSSDPAANDLYLRAEHADDRMNESFDLASWKQVISLYKQAIAKAPDFALARANLSILESNLVWRGPVGEDAQRLNADARTQAERALELAPDLADAHLAMGLNEYWGHRHYAAALVSFDAALRLRPNDADALSARGFVFKHQGKFDAASASLQQAFTQDPRSSHLATELGLSYMVVGRYAEAKTALQQALVLDPNNITAKLEYSNAILYANGDLDGAMAAAQGASPSLQSRRTYLLTYQRNYRAALNLLRAIPGPVRDRSLRQARLYQLMGEVSKAQPLFTKALSAAQAQLKSPAADPLSQSLALGDVAGAEIGLGHTAAGLAAIVQSQVLSGRVDDHVSVPEVMELTASWYAIAGRADLAVPLLAKAIATPGIGAFYSPVMLWLDPVWDPIRKDPVFQALLKKYASDNPKIHSGG